MKEKLFRVVTWSGDIVKISDKQLRNLIVEQSKTSNYNWLASSEELYKVCHKKGFDKDCAKDIETAVINCFTTLLCGDYDGYYLNYACECCNDLYYFMDDEKVFFARKKFINNYLDQSIKFNNKFPFTNFKFFEARIDWLNEKTAKLLQSNNIKFNDNKFNEDFEKYMGEYNYHDADDNYIDLSYDSTINLHNESGRKVVPHKVSKVYSKSYKKAKK